MKTFISNLLKLAFALVLVAGLSGAGQASAASLPASACVSSSGAATCVLWATTGTATLFGTTTVNIWGYSTTSMAGSATLPGPALIVNQGDAVTVTLHNVLSEPTALYFQGQAIIPDTTGVAANGTKTYTFIASQPGTFLYEAGLIPGKQHQVAMGMYGALIVKPAGGTAYGTPSSAYDEESLLVLSEIDTTLNTVVPALPNTNPAAFDMRNFAPKYFLINGKAYSSSFNGDISVTSGNKVLLRYVNAGLQAHAMSTLGLSQKVIAQDGHAFAHPHSMIAETIASGQTLDALVTIPASAAINTRYAVYDANLMLRNANISGLGGMLTFIKTGSSGIGGTGDTTGPSVSSLGLSPNPTNGSVAVSINASISDVASGNSNVTAAEYYIDSTTGTATAMTGAFGSPTASVNGTISVATLATLSSATHTIYVRGQDSLGHWGPFLGVSLILDKTGPTTSGLSLTPNPSSGAVTVALVATGSDVSTGNSNVTAAEYWVDSGAHTAMTAGGSASPTRSFTANIPAGLSQGTHVVSVRSQDALGNWGAAAAINLLVGDTAAPTTSNVSTNPPANNGSFPMSTSVQAVRVTASFSDVATGNSNIAAAEGFIDAVGTTGSGFVFIANDGLFNSPAESGYSDIPLVVVGTLSVGNHTIYVHAKDAAGNWGANATYTLVIDKTAPTFTSVTLSPTSIFQATATVNMTINGAADTGGAGLYGGEYWFDTNTPTSFSGIGTISIPTSTLNVGSHTLSARIRDNAGNWSTVRTANLSVVLNAIFDNGFETGNGFNAWGWSSRSTNQTGRLNVTSTSPMVGARMLQAQGNNTNYVQYNFGSGANPATGTFDARFYFNPNGNTSTGQDIFAAATSSNFNTNVFHVRYRVSSGQAQVQLQIGNTVNGSWVNITNAVHRIEVVWQAVGSGGPNPGTLVLYVDGVSSQTLTTTSTNTVGAVRLGSVTNGGSSTLEYFDAFSSKRATTPLIGP
jgi:hypothetical protein